jgi:flagellar basal body-associated protein FliL
MMKLLPIVLLLIGSGAGVGAGIFLRPAPAPVAEMTDKEVSDKAETAQKKDAKDEGGKATEYVKLSNQFVVPVVKNRVVVSLVVLALSLEVPEGTKEGVFKKEPKVRDSFLQVLFDHANVGGFDGSFTEAGMLNQLREALREVAQRDLGEDGVNDVLILEIARQDY